MMEQMVLSKDTVWFGAVLSSVAIRTSVNATNLASITLSSFLLGDDKHLNHNPCTINIPSSAIHLCRIVRARISVAWRLLVRSTNYSISHLKFEITEGREQFQLIESNVYSSNFFDKVGVIAESRRFHFFELNVDYFTEPLGRWKG